MHLVQHGEAAVVRAGDRVAVPVEVVPPGIAAPFAEQLELLGLRMVAPNALLKGDAADVGRDRASVGSVEPAIGAPLQRIGKRVRVFHAEPAKQNFRIAVGQVVLVLVGIEEQVRRLHDEHAPVPQGQAGRQVQTGNEILALVGVTVAVNVFQNRNPVDSLRTTRGRLGHAVVNRTQIVIDLHHLEPGRIGILQILNDPHPPAAIELHRDRLLDLGLAGEQLDLEARRNAEVLQSFFRRQTTGLGQRRRSSQNQKEHEQREGDADDPGRETTEAVATRSHAVDPQHARRGWRKAWTVNVETGAGRQYRKKGWFPV